MPKSKKKKALQAGISGTANRAERQRKKERRTAKVEHRKRERKPFTADQWAIPAPSHLVAKLERPQHKSRYHSYFEFAENTERKQKKLEFQVTNDPKPPPGFKFVPIGDPQLTNECKEISRESGAMIFIVSSSKEENSKISEHIYRTGYHFRETIVDTAQEKLGERTISKTNGPAQIEPIPESQEEINKQADGAIRDLFPRIPHTDRQMIIEHAFKKGAQFHGEPTVGLQANIPLSRRVQLAVLAHIRHTHTRYDRLLRETTWMNARKAVEPVCLDVLVRWRGDEETGRDQIDEILREVVIITDSEDSDDSSEDDDSSDEEEGELTSASSGELSHPNSRNQNRPAPRLHLPEEGPHIPANDSMRTTSMTQAFSIPHQQIATPQPNLLREKKAQKGFKRYQAAWEQAVNRHGHGALASREHISDVGLTSRNGVPQSLQASPKPQYPSLMPDHTRGQDGSITISRPDLYNSHQRPTSGAIRDRNEVTVTPLTSHPTYYQNAPQRSGTHSPSTKEQRPNLLVRGSPGHSLQDMLVPSIETGSSDALVGSPHPPTRREVYDDFEQDSRPRFVVERRRRSPDLRQVIVIDDDSPQQKRRRVIHEDESGRFRPLPSRDQRLFINAPRSDSHLIHTPSVPPRDFLVERPGNQVQGLFREPQPEPAPGYRIPLYDGSLENRYFAGRPRTSEIGFGGGYEQEASHIMRPVDSAKTYVDPMAGPARVHRQVDQNMRVVERENVTRPVNSEFGPRSQIQQRPLPMFSVKNSGSRSHEIGPDSVKTDQTFIDSFSQSRARDVLPESSHSTFLQSVNGAQRYEDYSARPPAAAFQWQERSQVQNSEPMQYRENSQQHTFQERGQHHITGRQPLPLRERPSLPGGNIPSYMGNVDPRRQVIVYE